MRKSTKVISLVAILAFVAAACSNKAKTPTAAASCATEKLKGFAMGGAAHRSATFTSAGTLAQAAKPVVKIGMFGDLTGGASALVIPIRNAAQLAIAQANAA